MSRFTIEDWYREVKRDNIEFWTYPQWIEKRYHAFFGQKKGGVEESSTFEIVENHTAQNI